MSTPIICITGDSQTAGSNGTVGDPRGVPAHLRFQIRADITNLAVAGTTLINALAYWNSLSTDRKAAFDYVFIAGCFNSLAPATSSITAYMTAAQNLVNQINLDKKSSCRVIMSTLVPVRQYLIDTYGGVNGALMYTQWLAVNQALQGSGGTPITNVYGCAYEHTDYLNDGTGTMQSIYWATGSDKLHPNIAGEDVIADSWVTFLR